VGMGQSIGRNFWRYDDRGRRLKVSNQISNRVHMTTMKSRVNNSCCGRPLDVEYIMFRQPNTYNTIALKDAHFL